MALLDRKTETIRQSRGLFLFHRALKGGADGAGGRNSIHLADLGLSISKAKTPTTARPFLWTVSMIS